MNQLFGEKPQRFGLVVCVASLDMQVLTFDPSELTQGIAVGLDLLGRLWGSGDKDADATNYRRALREYNAWRRQ